MFWGWLKAFVQYSFYPVVANAVVFVFGSLLTNYIKLQRAAVGWRQQQWAMLAPMLIMMFAFTYGVLKIPTLVNDIFAGRSGSSALAHILRISQNFYEYPSTCSTVLEPFRRAARKTPARTSIWSALRCTRSTIAGCARPSRSRLRGDPGAGGREL